ncbi:MAG: MATE family efflux transporter [Lachnospiraceae bacterium]|nr:MATE family efflux transporter [Lachnospiraceae bacterium]
MLGLSCYILADTYFIAAKLGADGLTALNLAIPAYSVMHGIGLLIGVGGATRFAIMKSRGEGEKADQAFTLALAADGVLSLVFLAAGLSGSGFLAGLLGAEGRIHGLTAVYMKTLYLFAPLFLLNNTLIAFIRNDGRPGRAMAGMMCGSLFNIVMDYIFLYPLNLGMFGAAFATCASPAVSMAVMSPHFWKHQNTFHVSRNARPGLSVRKVLPQLGNMFSLGLSALINELSSAVVLIVFNLLILNMAGNIGVAAYGVVANLALVAFSLFNGVSQGGQPLFSEAYGTGMRADERRLFRYSVILSIAMGVLMAAGAWIFTGPLVALFNQEGNLQLAEMAHQGLRLYFIGFIWCGVNIVSAAYFSAVERPGASFVLSSMRGFFCILLFAAGLSALWGMNGIWLSFLAAEMTTCAAAVFFCMKGRKEPAGIKKQKEFTA